MKYCIFFLSCLLLTSACQKADPEEELSRFLSRLVEYEAQFIPSTGQIIIFDSPFQQNQLRFAKEGQQILSPLDTTQLKPSSQIAHQKAIQKLTQYIQKIEEEQMYQQDPSFYDVGPHLNDSIFNIQQMPQDSQLLFRFERNLRAVAPYYQTAIVQLKGGTPEKISLAIQANRQTYFHLTRVLQPQIEKIIDGEEQKSELLYSIEEARLAIKDYLAFCRSLEFEHYDQPTHTEPTR